MRWGLDSLWRVCLGGQVSVGVGEGWGWMLGFGQDQAWHQGGGGYR